MIFRGGTKPEWADTWEIISITWKAEPIFPCHTFSKIALIEVISVWIWMNWQYRKNKKKSIITQGGLLEPKETTLQTWAMFVHQSHFSSWIPILIGKLNFNRMRRPISQLLLVWRGTTHWSCTVGAPLRNRSVQGRGSRGDRANKRFKKLLDAQADVSLRKNWLSKTHLTAPWSRADWKCTSRPQRTNAETSQVHWGCIPSFGFWRINPSYLYWDSGVVTVKKKGCFDANSFDWMNGSQERIPNTMDLWELVPFRPN